MSYCALARAHAHSSGNSNLYASGHSDVRPTMREVRKALVVDDSPVNRKIAAIHLQAFGFTVAFAHDGREAIKQCSGTRFDLILMDVVLPGLNGLEAASMIRRQRHLYSADSIILGWSTSATLQECKCAGMDGVLPKPLDTDSLERALIHFQVAAFAEKCKPMPAVCFV